MSVYGSPQLIARLTRNINWIQKKKNHECVWIMLVTCRLVQQVPDGAFARSRIYASTSACKAYHSSSAGSETRTILSYEAPSSTGYCPTTSGTRKSESAHFSSASRPRNNAEKIMVPLSIAPALGEEDSRVPMCESLQLWDIASKRVYVELMACELDGWAMVFFPCLVGVRDLGPGGSADYFFLALFRRSGRERD